MMHAQIENTSTCDAACVFCVYPQSQRWGGLIKRELYDKIVDELATIPSVTSFCITGLGEPTLDARLPDLVRYARMRMPSIPIQIYSNGVHLRPKLFDALADAGISLIVFSLNAANAEQHESVMKLVGKYDRVCQNIDYAIANNRGIKIEVRAVMLGEWDSSHELAFKRRWGSLQDGGHGILVLEGNWAGENRTVRAFKPNEWCRRSTMAIYILYDGRVTPCCFDPTGKVTFGDLNTQTLRDVYASDRYVQFRQDHVNDQADKWDICKVCSRI